MAILYDPMDPEHQRTLDDRIRDADDARSRSRSVSRALFNGAGEYLGPVFPRERHKTVKDL